jgi:hypothetical protein
MARIISNVGLLRYTVSLDQQWKVVTYVPVPGSPSPSAVDVDVDNTLFHFCFHSMANILLDKTLNYLLLFKFLVL